MKKLLLILMLLVTPLLSQTQKSEYATFLVTVDIGYKTVTDEGFDDIYDSAGMLEYGATTLIHIAGPFIFDGGYHLGSKSGTTVGTYNVDTDFSFSSYNLGLVYGWGHTIQNYIGGGYVGMSVTEEAEILGSYTVSGGGYYLVYGIAARHNLLAYNLSIKYSDVSIDSPGSGTAGSSLEVGGFEFLFGLGIAI